MAGRLACPAELWSAGQEPGWREVDGMEVHAQVGWPGLGDHVPWCEQLVERWHRLLKAGTQEEDSFHGTRWWMPISNPSSKVLGEAGHVG